MPNMYLLYITFIILVRGTKINQKFQTKTVFNGRVVDQTTSLKKKEIFGHYSSWGSGFNGNGNMMGLA